MPDHKSLYKIRFAIKSLNCGLIVAYRQGVVESNLVSLAEVEDDAAFTALLLDLVFDALQGAGIIVQGCEWIFITIICKPNVSASFDS